MGVETGNINIDKIACAVVIYGTRLTECEVYETFIRRNLQSLDCLLVFDNSPASLFENVCVPDGVFKYYWNPSNPGVSANYNKAAALAKEIGCRWLLLLDQDTSFPVNALETYRHGVAWRPHSHLFAPLHMIADGRCLSPANVFCPLRKNVRPGTYSLKRFDVINSGLLVCVDDFIRVGGYKEDVGLDFSDFQFLERLRRVVSDVVVLDIECVQNFSNDSRDKEKLLERYEKFCRGVANFEFHSLRSIIKVCYLAVKHTVALAVRCRTFSVFKVLFFAMLKKERK